MKTPEQIKQHQCKYHDGAWRDYEPIELAQWVCLLSKRATHRKQKEKAQKDITDAKNYLSMLTSYVSSIADKVNEG